jgi:hypothetical protein
MPISSETRDTMNDNHIPFEIPLPQPPLNDDWAARREAAAAARSLIEHLITTTSDADVLRTVAAALREQTGILAEAPQLPGRKAFADFDNGRLGTWSSISHELNPLEGPGNPLSPPLTLWIDGETAHGFATLGWQYEGPPSTVHGGYVCAIFDHFLGMAQKITGQPGVTGTLTTRFHHPTPLHTELRLIGRVVEVSGRKNMLSGEIWANGIMTASCQGLFIHISKERFQQMTERRGE